MSTTDAGRKAEEQVAQMLESQKHKIDAKNWRTRWCEIDIVSTRKKIVYFTEVKFRSSDKWGDGLDYITPKKLKQMKFAAEMWISKNDWKGEVQLQVASVNVDGQIELLEIV